MLGYRFGAEARIRYKLNFDSHTCVTVVLWSEGCHWHLIEFAHFK